MRPDDRHLAAIASFAELDVEQVLDLLERSDEMDSALGDVQAELARLRVEISGLRAQLSVDERSGTSSSS